MACLCHVTVLGDETVKGIAKLHGTVHGTKSRIVREFPDRVGKARLTIGFEFQGPQKEWTACIGLQLEVSRFRFFL